MSLNDVRKNFAAYGLLENQIEFVKGWFKSTLASLPVRQLAVLRIDADLHDSTCDVLSAFYDRVSNGWYVIVDDFIIPECADAVVEFRRQHGIIELLEPIDEWAVCWRRK